MVIQSRKAFVRGLLGLCVTIFLNSCATTSSKEEKTLLEMGFSLLQDQQFPECVSIADTVLEKNRGSGGALNLKGLCLMGVGRYVESEKLLSESCEKNPQPDCFNQLAALYLKLQNPIKSQEMANKALSYPTYGTPENAWANLALAKLQLKDVPGAQKAVKNALELNSANCSLRILSARIFQRRGLLEEALRQSEESVTLCPMSDEAHFWKAYSLFRIGRKKDSFRTYEYIINEFKKGTLVEQSRVNLDLLENHIPIPEPKL